MVDEMFYYIIYIGLLLLLIIGMCVIYLNDNDYEIYKRRQVSDTIKWIYQVVNKICDIANFEPSYQIKETNFITYVEKSNSINTINLLIWNDKYHRVFSHNTLIYATLHEISHILSPSISHNSPFDLIENKLFKIAIDLGYYDPDIPLEKNYYTIDNIQNF